MTKNELLYRDDKIIRILQVNDNQLLVIDCIRMTMPVWKPLKEFDGYEPMNEQRLHQQYGFECEDDEVIEAYRRQIMYKRYTMIAGVIAFIGDIKQRNAAIQNASDEYGISKQSIRKYLCKYLVFQNLQVLLPKKSEKQRELTQDEKNMRWSLNKFFYNYKKNSLKTAYTMMLKEKYCDASGVLVKEYPSFYQYRYFYRKTRKMQNYYISRNGLTNYQRNNRPCTGDRVQQYAPYIGTGMVDATICDIYLVNESGELVGRPILTACIDAYSGLCCGYSLGWEGGIYSLRDMCLNIVTDKREYCKSFGIEIAEEEWDSKEMPLKIVSDQGAEYVGYTFEQLAELGITIVNLLAYRPELKGSVEKFFDTVQSFYKKHLKGKGVIEPDYQERGAHDYRKDACLTMEMFSEVIVRCILHYNTKHVLENYPFTEEMLDAGVKPYANSIWNYGKKLIADTTIAVTKEKLILCLLPRTEAKFTRFGFVVNKMRYHNPAYTEKYLTGGKAVAAYDTESVSYVWLIEKGEFIRFELVDSRYMDRDLASVIGLRKQHKSLIQSEQQASLQADIELADHIQVIADRCSKNTDTQTKQIGEIRKKEKKKKHTMHSREVGLHE